MSQYAFLLTAGILFLFISIGHILRVILNISVVVREISVPMWPSAVAFALMAFLAFEAFRLARKSGH